MVNPNIHDLVLADPVTRELNIKITLDCQLRGIWHNSQCLWIRDPLRPQAGMVKEDPIVVPLHERTSKNTCPDCIDTILQAKHKALVDIISAEFALFEFISSFDPYNLRGLSQFSGIVDYQVQELERLLGESDTLPSSIIARIEAFIDPDKGVRAKVHEIKRSATIKAALRGESRGYVPECFEDEAKADSEMSLIGITSFDRLRHSLVRLAVECYSIFSHGDNHVLYAPGYIYAYIQRVQKGIGFTSLVHLYEVPGIRSAEVTYTAARLWEPEGDGPFADLEIAIKAAEAL